MPLAFMQEDFFVTARVRSTMGRYCFHRCLSVHRGGGGVRVPPLGGLPDWVPPGGRGGPGTPPGVPDWVPPQGGPGTPPGGSGYPPGGVRVPPPGGGVSS